jgi:hypothetical protein
VKVLVCGGRDYSDKDFVFQILDELPIELLIHGAARGADSLAGEWAAERRVPCMAFPAPWGSQRWRGAGPTRNGWMLAWGQPDVVVAFPGGSGTADMVRRAGLAEARVVDLRGGPLGAPPRPFP